MHRHAWRLYTLLLATCLFAFGLGLSFPVAHAEGDSDIIGAKDVETCLGCHGEALNPAKMKSAAHGKLVCQDCHRGVDRFPHPEKAVAQKPSCRTCHAAESDRLAASVHRAGNAGKQAAPTCQSCHGAKAHLIPVAHTLTPAKQDVACVTCHAAEAGTMSLSVHGQPGFNGAPRASCRSCHDTDPHNIQTPNHAVMQGACASCHNDVATAINGSVHKQASLQCATCHTGSMHNLRGAPSLAAKTDAACRACHQSQVNTLATSAHGRQNCRDCHDAPAHGITAPPSTPQEKSARCATCHADISQSLAASVHGRATGADGKTPPNCVTCHGDSMHAVAKKATLTAQPRDAVCRTCHKDESQALAGSVHSKAFMVNGKPVNCFACHGSSPHAVHVINAATTAQIVSLCKQCHADKVAIPGTSRHDRPDKVAGDHPTCLTCHAKSIHGASIHGITKPPKPSPTEQVRICSRCHADEQRMARYGMNTEAVSSYLQSFHGRSVVNFNSPGAATCTDCHGLHAVMAPEATESPVNNANVARTCGKCHPDAKMNFAMSGANHLRLKIEQNPILRIEELAFMWLIYGAMCFLFIMVLLDLRRKLFDPDSAPACGKLVTILISAGLLSLVGGIIFAYLHRSFAWIFWVASIGIAFIAYLINYYQRKKQPPHGHDGRIYQRFSRTQRVQHFLLALGFTLLVLTGFPLHFAHIGWTHYLLLPFGGLGGARIVHRIAGTMMVVNFIWHLGYLLTQWRRARFSLKSWTMFPAWKDVRDVIDYFKWGFGLRKNLPEWERFQFREKFDYFADIWGTLVMGATGVMLWFPVVLGNHLPEWAIGFAYIAHSYEGTLALMAILVWHFYNTHFNPDMFPMNPVWWTGTMTEEEMAREHPLEKARIDAATAVEKTTVQR